MKIEHILPADIERRSMEIIEAELGPIQLPPDEKDIIKRVVHTPTSITSATCVLARVPLVRPWKPCKRAAPL